KLLGYGRFVEIAAAFATRFPPRGPVLYDFGREFPEYLQSRADLSSIAPLFDVAAFDWRIDVTGHRSIARFGERIALSESVALQLDSSLCCQSASHEVDAIRDGLSDFDECDLSALPTTRKELWYVFWRARQGVMVKRISRPSYQFLSSLL